MSIKLVSTGGGSVTIQEPNTASDFTLSVPARTATVLADDGSGKIRKIDLPTGSVIQVVESASTAFINTTSTSFVTTGLSASITPSSASNKILVVLAGGDIDCQGGGRQNYVTIFRNNTTNLGNGGFGITSVYHDTARSIVPASASVLDSPATTSSVTYTVYFRTNASRVDFNGQQARVTLTLMEITA